MARKSRVVGDVKYVAKTGLTWWGPEISARLLAGEPIPHEERGDLLEIQPGEVLPGDFPPTSIAWLLEQNLVEEME